MPYLNRFAQQNHLIGSKIEYFAVIACLCALGSSCMLMCQMPWNREEGYAREALKLAQSARN